MNLEGIRHVCIFESLLAQNRKPPFYLFLRIDN